MGTKRFNAKLLVTLFLLLLPICRAFAIDPSPAGGGCLEVSKSGGYAFVANHDDFGKNLVNEFALEMWFYMKRDLRYGEVWVLLDKEGSYMLTLSGLLLGPNDIMPVKELWIAIDLSYNYPNGSASYIATRTTDQIPSNQWHHIAYIHGEKGYWLYIDGEQITGGIIPGGEILNYTNDPLYISGSSVDLNRINRWNIKSLVQFSEGLIDEVRISNKVRYPVGEVFKFAVPQGRFEPDENTLALWHFDGDRAEWLKDASRHEHTLTAVNLNYYSVGVSGKLPTIWGQIKSN